MINGNLSLPFRIERGVRQGCPLSMLLFVIFQEPLYKVVQNSNVILPPLKIENQKCAGYADDTTFFVKDLKSIQEIFLITNKFENATNSKLNVNKTKIYGFGAWHKRTNWPIVGLKVETEHFLTLGIIFSCHYNVALEATWQQIINKIKRRIPLIIDRNLSLYQKVILVNSLLASKIWYVSHVYPLPLTFCKLIENEFLNFIWKRNYRPIKRDVLYNPKIHGGLGLVNIFLKAKSIFVATTLKRFINANESSLIKYYLALRINTLFNIRDIPVDCSHVNAPFYEYSVDIIRKCVHRDEFPNTNSKGIYEMILPIIQPEAELRYPNFDWKFIWNYICFKYMDIHFRSIVFKYIHEILPNRKKLNEWYKSDPNCNECNVEENNIHMMLYCGKVQRCKEVLIKIIYYLCNINIEQCLLRCLFFDFPKISKQTSNTLCIIISSYIANIWYNRESSEHLDYKFKAKIKKSQYLNMKILQEKRGRVFTPNYCELDTSIIDNL